MPLSFTFHDGNPRSHLANRLAQSLKAARRIDIVVGFLTHEGLEALFNAGLTQGQVRRLVIGRGTLSAWKAVRDLSSLLGRHAIRVHLGYALQPGKMPIRGYRPMMHSKIYYLEGTSSTTVFIGSNNTTGFALTGKNAEAGFLVDGNSKDAILSEVSSHIDSIWSEAVPFDESMIEAYARINAAAAAEEMDSLGSEIDLEKTSLMLIDCLRPGSGFPKARDIIYFAIPNSESREQEYFKSLDRRIDIYLYPVGSFATSQSGKQVLAIEATTRSTQHPRGTSSTAYTVQWEIRDFHAPRMIQASQPIPGHTQAMNVEVQVERVMGHQERFEYYQSAKSRTRFSLVATHESTLQGRGENSPVVHRGDQVYVVREILQELGDFFDPYSPVSIAKWMEGEDSPRGFRFFRTKGRRPANRG